MSNTLQKKSVQILVIAALALLAISQMLYHGVPGGNDLNQHFQFAEIFYRAVASGEIYPSLAGTTNQGYGDVGVRFYPPLAYYVLSLGKLLTGEWFAAAILTYFLIFFAGGLGVFFWANEEYSVEESLLAAGIFTFAPYHLNQIYNNSLVGEFAASAVLPFCFLFVTRVIRRGAAADVLGLAISVALLLLTHLPTSVIAAAVLTIYSFALLRKHEFLKSFSKLAIGVSAALAAASFYLVRMTTEMNWLRLSAPDYYYKHLDYRENYLLVPSHVRQFQNNESSLLLADIMLLVMIALALPTAIFLLKKYWTPAKFTISVGVVFVISVLMTTPLTSFIWDNLPILQKVQFPWRWFGVVSIGGAVFAARGIFQLSELMKRNNFLAPVLGLILVLFSIVSVGIVKQAFYIPRAEFNEQMKNIAFTGSFDCWLPIWAKPEASQTQEKVSSADRATQIIEWNPATKIFTVAAGSDQLVRVAAFYYPHWRARAGGAELEVRRADDGAILIPISENAAEITLEFVEPFSVKLSYLISVVVWSIFAVVGILLLVQRCRNYQPAAVLKNL